MRNVFLAGAICLSSAVASNASERTAPAPHESVEQRFSAIRHNDTRALLRTVLSDEQFAQMGAKWNEMRHESSSDEEKAKFADGMRTLTAPDAERTLMAMLKPQLEQMRPQVPMMVGMFGGMISQGIQQDENLSSDEKQKAGKLVQAVSTFLSENDLTDEASAKRAISVVCRTARKLNVATLDDVQAMDFGQALRKADVLLGGVKELFSVYGVDFNAWIDRTKVETLSQTGSTATVRVHYEVFGVKDSVDEELILKDKRWISTKTEAALSGK